MSVDGYLKARGEYEEAKRQIAELSIFITSVGNALNREPDDFYFTNTSSGVSFQAALNPQGGVDATKWLSALQIMNLVSDLRQKKTTMLHEWESIPDNMRGGLIAPAVRRSR